MKLFSVALSLLLSSSAVLSDELSTRYYDQADSAYKAKAYAEAYPLYESLNELYPENPEINFLLGRCALELKLYDEAMAAFERVLMLNPQHNRTRLALARLYSEIEQYDLATAELDTLLNGQLPDNIRDIVLMFKSNIDKHFTRYRFNGLIVMGGGYDSNANNDIGNKKFLIPSFNLWINGKEEVSDSNLFALSILNFDYDFGDRGGWSLENSLMGYTKTNSKEEKNNLSLVSFSLIPTWLNQKCQLQFPITYDRIYLDNKGYTYNLSTAARVNYFVDTTSQISGNYTYRRGYFDDNTALNVSSHSWMTSYKKALGENPIIIGLNASYSINNEREGSRTDITSNGYGYGIEVSKMLPYQINGTFIYSKSITMFEKTDTIFGTRREDSRTNYEFRLSKFLQKNFSINTIASYSQNDSNQAPFEYDKTTFQMSGALSF